MCCQKIINFSAGRWSVLCWSQLPKKLKSQTISLYCSTYVFLCVWRGFNRLIVASLIHIQCHRQWNVLNLFWRIICNWLLSLRWAQSLEILMSAMFCCIGDNQISLILAFMWLDSLRSMSTWDNILFIFGDWPHDQWRHTLYVVKILQHQLW